MPQFASVRAVHAQLLRDGGALVCLKTVRRDIKSLGYRSLVRPTVSTRNDTQVNAKRSFARRELLLLRNGGALPYFSDESWITTAEGHLCRTQWVKLREDLIPREKKCRWNETCSLQVWGVIGKNFRHIKILPRWKTNEEGKRTGYTLDSRKYINVCLAGVVGALRGRRLQQDGAKAHQNKAVQKYLAGKGVATMESPELNMIERVWFILKLGVAERAPQNEAELRVAINAAWDAIPRSVMNATVAGYEGALKRAVQRRRHH